MSHLSETPLSTTLLPRKITIYLAAPPGDGIGAARHYFREYVKPVLVAAAVDYDIVEGRKGGETRVSVAEAVRKWRRQNGEPGERAVGEEGEEQAGVHDGVITPPKIREMYGIKPEVPDDESGVMVVGRHTWKEFVQGMHEGWLGPADSQIPPASPGEDGKSIKQPQRPSTVLLEEYHKKALPSTFPLEKDSLPVVSPAIIIPFPHILGFLNTPLRIYRYLSQRHLADRVGRETAALCLGFSRPFHKPPPTTLPTDGGKLSDNFDACGGEFDFGCYPEEERDWGKKYRKVTTGVEYAPGEGVEKNGEELSENQRFKLATQRDAKEWARKIEVDGRIAERMRRYDLPVETCRNEDKK